VVAGRREDVAGDWSALDVGAFGASVLAKRLPSPSSFFAGAHSRKSIVETASDLVKDNIVGDKGKRR
jgi:hypothetical protein